jgi:hypothetical protein
MTPTEETWLVMDGRYHADPDAATCLYATDTKKDAEEFAEDYPGSVVVSSSEL